MTTYTVTAKRDGETEVFYGKTAAEVKATKKNLWGWTITTKKETSAVQVKAPKCYYRGEEVTVIEGRHNGYTLVFNGQRDIFANTVELVWK
jgi:hypothetical protein